MVASQVPAHALSFPVSPGLPCTMVQGLHTSKGHPAKGVSRGSNQSPPFWPCALAGSGRILPKGLFPACSKMQWAAPLPVPSTVLLLLLCVLFLLSPALHRADLRAAFTQQGVGNVGDDSNCLICEPCLLSPVVLSLPYQCCWVASRKLLCRQ